MDGATVQLTQQETLAMLGEYILRIATLQKQVAALQTRIAELEEKKP